MRKLSIILLAASVSLPAQVLAWGELGHQTVAGIAERILAKDANTKKALQDILGVEPLAIASTWPDEVRSDDRFKEFRHYHFITYGDDNKAVPKEKDAITVLTQYPGVLTGKKASREEKMIALRYIVHVVGDIHQPLHVGNTFDVGGNICKVVWKTGSYEKETNLHSVWDTELVNHVVFRLKGRTDMESYYGYKELAAALMEKYPDLVKSKEKSGWSEWADESWKLANEKAYTEVVKDPKERAYCNSQKDESAEERKQEYKTAPVLDQDFADSRAAIVEQQLVKGGVRLARFLKAMLKGQDGIGPAEKEILSNLLKENSHIHHE